MNLQFKIHTRKIFFRNSVENPKQELMEELGGATNSNEIFKRAVVMVSTLLCYMYIEMLLLPIVLYFNCF